MAEQTVLEIPFEHHGRSGILAVRYGPNDSVVESGFDLLQGSGFDVTMCLGYPTMHAWVASYGGSGYRTLSAWLQIIVDRYYERLDDGSPSRVVTEVDAAEAMRALGVPFFAYGYPAAIYDAPCNNLGDYAHLEWLAETFLVTFPSRLDDDQIAFLAGFRWGYEEWDEAGQRRVSIRRIEEIGRSAWEAHLPMLRRSHPGLRFA